LRAELQERKRLREVILGGILLVRAEGIAVRQAAGGIVGHTSTGLSGLRQRGVGFEGHEIKSAQPDTKSNLVSTRADGSNDFMHQAGAVLERAAAFAGLREGAEKFTQEVAVAMLDIHEIGARIPGDDCREIGSDA